MHQTTTSQEQQRASAEAILAPYVDQHTVLLTTFRRTGAPVGTPVNLAIEGDHGYFRTWDDAGKFKRLRHTPDVTVAPATIRGVPTGPAIEARTRLLSGAESAHAARLLARKHPFLQGRFVPLIHRLRRNRTVHFELSPLPA